MWLVTYIAELNRTPFDFAEGESELVSGFNIEYGSVKFALIFMAEYGIIYLISLFTRFIFFFWKYKFFDYLWGTYIRSLIIWIRFTLLRFRYNFFL